MKRLLLIFLCLLLTSCTYLGATEDILISSPDELSVSTIDPNHYAPATTTVGSTDTVTTDEMGNSDSDTTTAPLTQVPAPEITHLILNTSSEKIHYFDSCSYANRMNEKNRKTVPAEDEESLIAEGYTVCSWCAKERG